jgi:hypothetical protein
MIIAILDKTVDPPLLLCEQKKKSKTDIALI